MSERANGWMAASRVAGWIDKVLDKIIALFLIVALAYGGFGLWDTWKVYHNAGVSDDILSYRPSLSDGDAHSSLSQLQALYPDVCAWLTVDGTNIDYPVMQGKDNFDYINKGVDGEYSLTGSLFLDYRNSRDFYDYYSLIYGHHMAGKVMFGEITDFLKDSFFEENTTGWLFLADRTYKIEWFACVETSAYDKYFYAISPNEDQQTRQERLDHIQEIATQYRDLVVTPEDQIIALSTCLDSTTDGRAILIGRLRAVEEGVT